MKLNTFLVVGRVAIAQTAMKSGSFVAVEHPTVGTAQIVINNGKRYLEFNPTFKTENGPDLYVLLHRPHKPESYEANDYVSLGRVCK